MSEPTHGHQTVDHVPTTNETVETLLGGGAASRLQLLGEIARGGMGAVLKGRDTNLGRDVAVKVLLDTHQGHADLARRFLAEARIGGQLQHPGVVPVYELGVLADQRPYFTMKLVEGQTLATLLTARRDPLDERPRLLTVFEQVCQTLAYAHARGVIHRDLKPLNIMVGAFGEVQVMDWGLAKVLGGDSKQSAEEAHILPSLPRLEDDTSEGGSGTRAGSVMGTPAYMAPEQARGEVERIDERADVFGLGAILCEVLTGRPPYVGKGLQVMTQAREGRLAEVYSRLDGCGAEVELIALAKRCLAAEPAERPRHGGEVAREVTAYQQSVAERLRRAELARAAEEARALEARATAAQERRARRLTLALASSLLLTVLGVGGGWLWVRTQHETRLEANNRAVRAAFAEATTLRERARGASGTAATALAAQAREQGKRAEALVESGPTDGELSARVRALLAELAEEEKDRRLLTALDAASLAQTEVDLRNNTFLNQRAVPLFREAFAGYGLTVGEGEPAVVVARLAARPVVVREAALAALDEWVALAENPLLKVEEPHLDWLRAVLDAAEPEGWGKQVRTAAAEKDSAKRLTALVKLAESADVAHRPARAIQQLVVRMYSVDAEASVVSLLRRAQPHHAGDFWINSSLGSALQKSEKAAMFRRGQTLFGRELGINSTRRTGVVTRKRAEAVEATPYLTAAVALRPDNAGARLNLGHALHAQGKLEEAIAELRKAIQLNPKYVAPHHSLGNVFYDRGEFEEAIAEYRKAIQLDSKYAGFHNNLGNALQSQGKHSEAMTEYRKAIQLDPKSANAHNNLGRSLYDRGQREEAIAEYHKAIQVDPTFALVHVNLGNALSDQGKREECIVELRKACQLDPDNALFHNNLGKTLSDQGKLEEAIPELRKAVQLAPDKALLHGNLGFALHTQRKLEEAVIEFRKALDLDPKHADLHNNLGNVLRDQGKLEEAITEYRKASQLDPTDALPHNNLGAALAAQGKLAEATAEFRTAIRLDPKDPGPQNNLGSALHAQGKIDEAIAEYRKAIQFNPKYADAHLGLGNAFSAQGKRGEAIAEYRRAIALNPRLVLAHTNLGNNLLAQGQLEEASEEFREAIRLEPRSPNSHFGLGVAMLRRLQFASAHDSLRRALELLPPQAPQRAFFFQVFKSCERSLELDGKLPRILAGKLQPANVAERLEYARLCALKKLPGSAAQLFAEAFVEEPKRADDWRTLDRYNAACSAALVAAGQGEDAKKFDAKEQTRWRQQARDWLRGELAVYGKIVTNGKPQERKLIRMQLKHWQLDKDLVGIRDEESLRKLPAKEREACQKLWADVEILEKEASEDK